jgi:hypothetical protein
MNICLLGANGRVGRLVVNEALDRGHSVVALIHNKSTLSKDKNLKIVKGDIYSQESINEVVKGSDVVISALGSWGTPKKDILSAASERVIPAITSFKVKGFISLTGADARSKHDDLSTIHRSGHSLIKIVGSKVIEDGEKHLRLLADSSISYSVIRSPIMNNWGKQEYSLVSKRPLPWATINRHAVALAMLDLAEDNKGFDRQSPYIVR